MYTIVYTHTHTYIYIYIYIHLLYYYLIIIIIIISNFLNKLKQWIKRDNPTTIHHICAVLGLL